MSIFKKLFGGKHPSGEKSNISKPDIDLLLKQPNLNKIVIELDDYLAKLSDYGADIEKLNESQKIFFINQNLEREINNGGFNQFYYNSSGDFAIETISTLEKIGAKKTAEIVRRANNQFPESKVPKDRFERQDLLEVIEEEANPIWDKLDKEFYKYEDNLNQLNVDFIKKNIIYFK